MDLAIIFYLDNTKQHKNPDDDDDDHDDDDIVCLVTLSLNAAMLFGC